MERERDEPRDAASPSRQAYQELEKEHQNEVAEHKVTIEGLNIVRVIVLVPLALLIDSVLLWWFVLR